MVYEFRGYDFKGRSGISNQEAIEDFIIYSMDSTSRVRQFALDEASDLMETRCIIIKGWHGRPMQPEDIHFTCRLEYLNPIWSRGVYLGTDWRKYGTLHVHEDGSESRHGGPIW